MRDKGKVWTLGCAVLSVGVASAGPSLRPTLAVPLRERVAVAIDGTADEAAWKGAPVLTHLISPLNSSPAGAQTTVRVLADAEALYLTVKSDRLPTSARPKGLDRRDGALMSDVIEFHLKPERTVDRQYQIVFDAIGNIWDNRSTFSTAPKLLAFQRWKFDSKWDAPGMTHAEREDDASWTFEARMPWKMFEMAAPKDGQELLVNFCHADYGNGSCHNQLCEWAVDRAVAFPDWRNWGTLVFRRETAVVTAAEIAEGGKSVTVAVKAGARPFAGRVTLGEDTGAETPESRLDEAIAVPAGEERTFTFPLKRQSTLAWLEVREERVGVNSSSSRKECPTLHSPTPTQNSNSTTIIFRRYGRPAGTILMVKLQDQFNVRKRHIKIPNDAMWYNPFQFEHTLTGKTGNKIYGNPSELGARFFVEAPEGVEVPYIKYSDWGGDNPVEKPLVVGKTVRDGKPHVKHEFRCFISGVNRPLVFMRAKLPAGTKGNVYLYLTWKTGAEEPKPFPFEVVSYGRVKPFERMQMRLDDITPRLAYAICADPAKELPTLGINVWKIPMNPSKGTLYYDETKEKAGERLARMVKDMKSSGNRWYFSIQNELNGIDWWVNGRGGEKGDPAAAMRDIDGHPVRTQFGNRHSPCFHYRGPHYRRTIGEILDSEAVRDYGVTWLVFDWELWNTELCYCERCLTEAWPKYVKDNALPGDWGSPRDFMRDERAHPEAARAFRAFGSASHAKLYNDFRADLNRGLDPKRIVWNAPKKGGFVFSDWRAPREAERDLVDFFDWPFGYRPPWQRPERDEEVSATVYGQGRQVVCSLNAMQGCEFNQEFPPVATWYNMLEAASMGVRGYEWWYAPVMDAETYWYVMRGLRATRPFEDIVLDGVVTTRGTERDCTWRRVQLGREALYCVRNYALKAPQTVTFTVDASLADAVWDAATGEKLADLAPGANAVRVPLGPDRLARLLYVGERFAVRKNML